jgi:hypothetical protein
MSELFSKDLSTTDAGIHCERCGVTFFLEETLPSACDEFCETDDYSGVPICFCDECGHGKECHG